MTRTISRTRLLRGTQSTRTRDVVPSDAVALRRRRLSGAGPTGAQPAEKAVAPPPKRRQRSSVRARTAAIGALEPGRDDVATSLANTDVRGPATGGPVARERSKLSRIRDGRYARSRGRFIV